MADLLTRKMCPNTCEARTREKRPHCGKWVQTGHGNKFTVMTGESPSLAAASLVGAGLLQREFSGDAYAAGWERGLNFRCPVFEVRASARVGTSCA